MKLWGGRFKNDINKMAKEFNDSFPFDKKLYKYDITGSIAHANMLAKQNIITKDDGNKIVEGLNEILNDIENDKIDISNVDAEDIHSFVENELIKKIGSVGKKLHTGRSRNDQVALDMKLYIRDSIDNLLNKLNKLIDVFDTIIKDNYETYMPGFTHLQKAQPITLSHHIDAYKQMFLRDKKRLLNTKNILNECPLGAAALAGTVYNIDRFFVANELGFDKPTDNSIDSVSDRDYLIEYIFDMCIIMMHLSRLSEEIILWNSDDYKYITISDEFSTGSSIMPQKKNPDIAELIRGKVGRVYGSLVSILTIMKSLPLAYNKDLQEDKQLSFDAIDTTKNCVDIMAEMLKNIKFNKQVMKKACLSGFINATDVADYLVSKNIPFRDAHRMVGELILLCEQKKINLTEVSLSEYNEICDNKVNDDIYDVISIENSIKNRKSYGGTGFKL